MLDDLKRGMQLGRYELLLRIGRGGMATVWVALERTEDRNSERLVAVKAILSDLAHDVEFTTMFLDEGRLVRSIHHDNVVDVYEVGEHEGVMYMAMEWVEGDSLHALIAEAGKRRPIPPEIAIRVIADAAAGLHAAHETRGDDGALIDVVHRDVSPHNILVGTSGQIKLVDFGVARAMGRLGQATSAGQLKGKFGYMSPEQATAGPVDRRSDVFSLGIVLFELTTGRRLFKGEHDAETLHLVVSGEIPKPSDVEPGYPPELEAIVSKALTRDLEGRYQTAKELQDALEGYLRAKKIVVPKSGIAALLKRVLGERIEQRRKAIRAIVRVGDQSDAAVMSTDTAFTPSGSNEHGSVTGVSGVTAPTHPSQVTGVDSVSQPGVERSSGSTAAAHAVSKTPRRDTPIGYLVGIAGLAIAIVAIVVVALRGRSAEADVEAQGATRGVAAPAAPASEQAAAPPRAEPAPPASGVSIDTLDTVADAGVHQRPRPGLAPAVASPDKGAAPPAEVKPAAAPAPAPKAPGELPRDNPY